MALSYSFWISEIGTLFQKYLNYVQLFLKGAHHVQAEICWNGDQENFYFPGKWTADLRFGSFSFLLQTTLNTIMI